ncbi:MAG: hypothetical protein V1784_08450 [bacterium]
MATDPETHELLEPLREFLETLSEELTSQKFIPAFREEIAELRKVFEDLSQSQETLERIAHGVERLRDVFAPAGTRLLTNVKDMEQQLTQHMAQLQGFAGEALAGLLQTHEELSQALRREAERAEESATASCETLKTALSEVEQRLSGLHGAVEMPQGDAVVISQPTEAKSHEFYEATRHALDVEWERIHGSLREGLSNLQQSEEHRLERLSTILREIVNGIGPQIRADVEVMLAPLFTRVQPLADQAAGSAERKKAGAKGRSEPPFPVGNLRGELSAVEGRMAQRLAEFRANYTKDWTKLRDALGAVTARLAEETAAQEKRAQESFTAARQSFSHLEQLVGKTQESAEKSIREIASQQKKEFTQHTAAEAAHYEKLEARIAAAQGAALAAIDKAHRESSDSGKRIAGAFQTIQETLQTDFKASQAEFEALLDRFSRAWNKQWMEKFHQITATLGQLEEIRGQLGQLSENFAKETQSRDERAEALQAEFHQVSEGLSQVRAAQEAHPRILKEAVNHAYGETQERLRQVIDTGYDRFLQQISSVAQTVERYANLLESLHKSDELALSSISADCKSLLKVAREEFDYLRSSEEALKKIFPLLERRLERQLGEIGGVRRVADDLEKSLQAVGDTLKQARASLAELMQEQGVQTAELAQRMTAGFREVTSALSQVHADVEQLQKSALATLQRELMDFTASKFEFMERALSDHQSVMKSELLARLDEERREWRKGTYWLFALVGFGLLLQLLLYYVTQGPLAPPVP